MIFFFSYLLKSLDIWQASMLLSLAKGWNFLVYILWAGMVFDFFRLYTELLLPPSSMVWKPCNWSSCRYHKPRPCETWTPMSSWAWAPPYPFTHSSFHFPFFPLTSQISSSFFQAQQMQFHQNFAIVVFNSKIFMPLKLKEDVQFHCHSLICY